MQHGFAGHLGAGQTRLLAQNDSGKVWFDPENGVGVKHRNGVVYVDPLYFYEFAQAIDRALLEMSSPAAIGNCLDNIVPFSR